MTEPQVWREEPIARHHDRDAFDCGVAALNEYLSRFARQNHVRGGSKTFVAVYPAEPTRVLAYYSINPSAVTFADVPHDVVKRLGRYEVPVFRLSRLAVSRREQGKLIGTRLLFAAARRAMTVAIEIGGVALAIDAKDERAATWYEHFGAVRLRESPLSLILPFEALSIAMAADR